MKWIFPIFTFLFLLSCTSTKTAYHNPIQNNDNPKKLAVFMDGTMNNASSYTNVSKLYNLTILQNNENVSATYIVGVGNHGVGLISGAGIGDDVKDAYLFLINNFQKDRKDEIYLFGFSRGAYAARILAGLLYVAGIPDVSHLEISARKKYINKIFSAYKGNKTFEKRQQAISNVIGRMPSSVDVEFIGLWDTVEALGFPNFKENYNVPNKQYVDQLCNIKKASQALSLNDDRASLFTPVLLSENHLITNCKKTVDIDKIVNEVWFFGAHSDVGGGYSDTEIDGISLNWMINEIYPFGLIPKTTEVYEDPRDKTHDPFTGFLGLFYKRKFRSLSQYSENSPYNNGKLKIHKTAIERINDSLFIPLGDNERNLIDNFSNCFIETENKGFLFEENFDCKLEVYSNN